MRSQFPPPRRRRATLLVVAAVVAGVLAAGAATGAAGAAGAGGPAGPAASARAQHDRVVAFWTPERVARAVPRDFVFDPASQSFRPAAKPDAAPPKGGGGGGGGGGSTTVIGASWTGGGEVAKSTGKVLFALGSTYYVCSAAVVNDAVSNRSLILTAAHCVFDESTGVFATNWMFVPDYDSAPARLTASGSFCSQTVYGCWVANALVVHRGFATAGSFNTQATLYDFAFAVVGGGGKSGTAQLDATVGSHPVQFSTAANGADTFLFGYPAAQKYKGNDLVYCRGPLGTDPLNSGLTYRVGCDMTGGSSGGPWFTPFANGTGTQMSVNSYGYSGITAMHGPKLNADTQSLYTTAGTAASNTIVG
jgi:hypothetical protein